MSTDHISHKSLRDLFRKQDELAEFMSQDEHVSHCLRCSEMLEVLQNTIARAGEFPSKPPSASHPSYDKISDMLSKTYDNSLPPEDAADFAAHIQSCALCYEVLGTVVEQALAPLPANVENRLAGHADVSLSGFVFEKYPPPSPSPSTQLSPKKNKKIKKTGTWVDRLLDFVPVPVPVAVMLALILFLGVPSGVYVVMYYQQDSIWDRYVYDDQVPYEFESGIALRGEGDIKTESPLQREFEKGFKVAISYYMIQQYETVIFEFERLEPTVHSLLSEPDHSVNYEDLRNFYFFRGVSHLALAQSKVHDYSEMERTAQLNKSVRFLTESANLTDKHNLSDSDRDSFFLGLTNGLLDSPELAISHLQRITPKSIFYDKAVQLISDLSQ